jgi:Leucine-rich repeat (LRR) protein
LRTLVVSNNQLRSLPGNIDKLRLMTSMDAYCNELMSVPPRLGESTSLRTLRLHTNVIDSLPFELGRLVNLKTLELHHNHLTQLPTSFGDLVALEELTLLKNQITKVAPSLKADLTEEQKSEHGSNVMQTLQRLYIAKESGVLDVTSMKLCAAILHLATP